MKLVHVLLAAAIAILASIAINAQSSAAPARYVGYPPHPKMMFEWHRLGSSSLGSGPGYLIATVPSDRWLVITHADALYDTSNTLGVYERHGGVDTLKIESWSPSSGVPLTANDTVDSDIIGATFRPGSEIVVQATSSGVASPPRFLRGYFVSRF